MFFKKKSFYFWALSGIAMLASVAVALNLRLISSKDVEPSLPIDSVMQISSAEEEGKRLTNPRSLKSQSADAETTKHWVTLESSLKPLHPQMAVNKKNATADRETDSADSVNNDPAMIEREQTNRLVSFLEQQMRREEVDVAWSENTKAEIATVIADNSFVNAIECFSTLCRIPADHASQDAEQHFLTQLTGLKAFQNTDAFVERQEHEDGSVSTQIFIARGGYRLPDPAPP
jgi:hypothetical protein